MSLTLERIFGDPDLNGPTPLQLKLAPGGTYVSYLKPAEDNFETLNLWVFDTELKTHKMLVNAAEFDLARTLSDAEKARRERLRISHQGIVEYYWSPDGEQILFPIAGNLYLYKLAADDAVTQLTDSTTFETDIRFSPDSSHIAFVREQNLYAMDLATRELTQLTTDGGDTISCGLADFIAQEEMHRYEGYWWSPDSRQIAFTWVDESPIEVSQRYEIDADHFGVFDQHYPYAGANNAAVKVAVVSLDDASIQWLNQDDPDLEYLARVDWFADSQHLAVQYQTRDQQTLKLKSHNIVSGAAKDLIEEHSDSWINLNNNFAALSNGDFIWGSERSGFNHLYLVSRTGDVKQAITSGEWVVTDVKCVTATDVYFEGFRDTPIEKHLYQASLDGSTIRRLTEPGFTHLTSVSPTGSYFIDRSSAIEAPPRVALVNTTGDLLETLEANTVDDQHPFAPYVSLMGEHRFDVIQAEDGQALHYRVIAPSSNQLEVNGKAPLILTVYGGPGVQRVNNEWLPPWHHYMASRGYGLLQLDNRGTANRGRSFESPIYGKLGDVEVRDQLAGLEAALSTGDFDPDRLAVFGHSYGGYMTLMLMMKSNRFKAGISVAPVTDWHLYDTHYTERYLGDPEKNQSGYRDSAVFPFVSDLSGKVLIIHGMADDNVLFSNSTKLYKALQDENIDFDIMNYPGAKHGLTGRKTNLHRYSLMDRFFAQHLNTGAV